MLFGFTHPSSTKTQTQNKQTRKAAKLREFKVFSHCTPTVLHVVAEISHGKDSVFFQLIPKELEFDP